MSEELKKTDIKKIAGRGCLIVAGILFLIFLCRYNQIKKESLYDTEGRTFAKATVMNVLQDNETKDGIYIGRQLVKLKITSGKWKGKTMENNWIDINDRLPNPGEYVLVSFENVTLPDIGRYETDSDGSGAFYPGDDDASYASFGIFVNA